MKTATDHLGNTYPSISAMCKAYGISLQAYKHRIGLGWTLPDALTTPLGEKLPHAKQSRDHLGNVYASVREMYEHYGLTESIYTWRRKSGWSLEKTLTTPVKERKAVVDHEGNAYKSVKEMCRHYGVSPMNYRKRLQRGWSVQEALTGTHAKVQDHLGNAYPSIAGMCRSYGIAQDAYWRRRHRGWSLEDALTKPVQQRRKTNENCK